MDLFVFCGEVFVVIDCVVDLGDGVGVDVYGCVVGVW